MIKVNFTDSEISSFLLINIKAQQFGEEFWIKSFQRAKVNDINGLTVTVASKKNNTKIVEVAFGDHTISLKGLNEQQQINIIEKFYEKLSSVDKDFEKKHLTHKKTMPEYAKGFEEKMRTYYFLNGTIKNFVEEGSPANLVTFPNPFTPQTSKKSVSSDYNHVSIYTLPKTNTHNTTNRTIDTGSIYWADLNPVVGCEMGGFRPVLVVGSIAGSYYIVPLSSKEKTNDALNIEYNGHKSTVINDICRPVDAERIYDFISSLDQKMFDKACSILRKDMEGLFIYPSKAKEINLTTLAPNEQSIITQAQKKSATADDKNIDSIEKVEILAAPKKRGRPPNAKVEAPLVARIEQENKTPETLASDNKPLQDKINIKAISDSLYNTLRQYILNNESAPLYSARDMITIASEWASKDKSNKYLLATNLKNEKRINVELNENIATLISSHGLTKLRFNLFTVDISNNNKSFHSDQSLSNSLVKLIIEKHPLNYLIFANAKVKHSIKVLPLGKFTEEDVISCIESAFKKQGITFSGDYKELLQYRNIYHNFADFTYAKPESGRNNEQEEV